MTPTPDGGANLASLDTSGFRHPVQAALESIIVVGTGAGPVFDKAGCPCKSREVH